MPSVTGFIYYCAWDTIQYNKTKVSIQILTKSVYYLKRKRFVQMQWEYKEGNKYFETRSDLEEFSDTVISVLSFERQVTLKQSNR